MFFWLGMELPNQRAGHRNSDSLSRNLNIAGLGIFFDSAKSAAMKIFSPIVQSPAGPSRMRLCGLRPLFLRDQREFSRSRNLVSFFDKISSLAWFGLVLTGIVFLLTATPASASTVVLQGGFGYPAGASAAGQALQSGFEVSVGCFAAGFDPSTRASDFPTLRANWIEYAKTTTATMDGVPGSFYLKHMNNDPAFAGRRLHLFITRTSDFASPVADGTNVTDYGIFTSTDAAWTFPAVGPDVMPPADLVQINTAQIDSALWGVADASALTLAFKAGTNNSAAAWNEWVASVFGQNTDPSSIDPNAVSGSSGLQNFVAFALNTNPVAPTAPAYTTITDDSTGRIGIEFTRTKSSGYSATAQASLNLSTWDLPLTEQIVADTTDTETVRAFPVFPVGTDTAKAFFRIQVQAVGQD